MSIAKRLAKYCSKDEASADAVLQLLNKFGLRAIGPRLAAHARARMVAQERYTTVRVRTATELSTQELDVLMQMVEAPKGAPVEVTIDKTVLAGTEVLYGGRKWSSNAKEKLNRFVTSK